MTVLSPNFLNGALFLLGLSKIKRFFEIIAVAFERLSDWLKSFFSSDPVDVNKEYWLKVKTTVITLLKEADVLLNDFYEKPSIDQDDDKTTNWLDQLSDFAAGKTRTLKIKDEDDLLLEGFKKTQKAQWILSLVAEMDIAGIEKVYSPEEEKSEDWVIFEQLFSNIREKTTKKRNIHKAISDGKQYEFAEFEVKGDGHCVDYSLGLWDRRETIDRLIEIINNKSIPKPCQEYVKQGMLELLRKYSVWDDFTTLRNREEEIRSEECAIDQHEHNLFFQYQKQFTSVQPDDMEEQKIYVWASQGKVYYALLNEEKEKVINSLERELDVESVRLLEEQGSQFENNITMTDDDGEVSTFHRIDLDINELSIEVLSSENKKKKLELKKLKDSITEKAKDIANYDDVELFERCIIENLANSDFWLTSNFISLLFVPNLKPEKRAIVWGRNSNDELTISHQSGSGNDCIHYWSTNYHAVPLVEIDNFEDLINKARFENRFDLR